MIDAINQNKGLLTDLGEESLCDHDNVSIEKPCCYGSNIECACNGMTEVVCENPNCTGIDDSEASYLYDKLTGGGSDCGD